MVPCACAVTSGNASAKPIACNTRICSPVRVRRKLRASSGLDELVAGADAAIFAQHQEVEADRDHLAARGRQHFPAQLDRIVVAVDAIAQAEYVALLLHP